MQKILLFFLMITPVLLSYGQNTLKGVVKTSDNAEVLVGATIKIKGQNSAVVSDKNGFFFLENIPGGWQQITISFTGFSKKTDTVFLPLSTSDTLVFLLEKEEEELDEVIVQSTRTSRTIENTPTRIETIEREEIDEKSNMRPSNVSMLLHESTGLQVQQTSATSTNASIRVQGLDGRYTQLLKDGYPNFGNFASGLSILEIPPLDLQQVEIIKGPASTLYGGGAIAGVINFISATPKEKPRYNFIINQSHVGQTNIGGYHSQKIGKFGYTILATANFQKPYDVDKDDFSELPESKNFTIHPTLYFYPNSSSKLVIGNSFTQGDNMGGDIDVIKGHTDLNHQYFEKNKTLRNITTLEFDKKLSSSGEIKLKQSLVVFNREITSPGYIFSGNNINTFTDVSYVRNKSKHTGIVGLNFYYDKFTQKQTNAHITLDARTATAGLYLQDTWDVSKYVQIESGIRFDHLNYNNDIYTKNQDFLLPRISALFKINDKLSSRVGVGLGYKAPTIFTEQTETMLYKNLSPLNEVEAEKSIGGTADVNFKTAITGDLYFSLNQLFFYSVIRNPLVLETDQGGNYFFDNNDNNVRSVGFETNLKLIFRNDLKLFAGYTYTNARAGYLNGNQFLPLVPKDKLNLALVYEKESNFKLGLEGYLTGNQVLNNGMQTPSFWEFGFMGEKTFGKVSVFINFENFTDQRQSKYKRVVNPPDTNPTFDDIWNHMEGFVVNGGIKIRW